MLAAGTLALLAAASVGAQVKYPVGTVTLVTHSSPGGGSDVMLRELSKHLPAVIGANFVVGNERGGSGAKAIAKLATSPTDGSTLYATTPTYINTSLLAKPQYTYRHLEGVVNLFIDPQIIFVRDQSPFKSLKDVVAAAKAKAGGVKFGVTTPGSQDRQVMERLKKMAGIDVAIVTHDGGGDLLINVLNGTVDLGVGEVQELRGQLEAKKVRLITTYTEGRLPQFPDVPTAREQGFDLVVHKFRGLAAPKGLNADVVKIWEEAAPKLLALPAVKKWYEDNALIPAFKNHKEYNRFLDAFANDMAEFFKEYKITKE
jgi:tripartite-type tricarboxylate transporter receptor subunit TctC